MKKKNKVGGLTFPDSKGYYKVTEIKTVDTGIKININQQNRMESSEINPYEYGQSIFDKSAKIIQWGKNSLFNKW